MLFETLISHPSDTIALRDGETVLHYGDLMTEIEKRVEKLSEVKVLGLALDNSVEWALWDLAALKAEIPCVPLPLFFTQEQMHHALHAAGVTHILSYTGLCDTGMRAPVNRLPEGTAKITFTSGTTGTPKGVCLPRTAMERVAASIVEVLGEEFAGEHQCVLPLAVLLENVAGVYAGLIAGCTVHLNGLQQFGEGYENLHSVLNASQATSVILVPEILRMLMAQVSVRGPLPDLKFMAVGGSKLDPTLILQARQMGLPVYEGYGLSECASVVSLNTPQMDKLGSVGKLLPHVKARITNGEIQIEDPGFLGYIGEPASAVLNSGDLGGLDENGFLQVTGRKKNVLITSYGRNVSPEWVESALLASPKIMQAIVYGDTQPFLSALVVPAPGAADIQDAIDAVNKSLPDYAQVKNFKTVPPFTVAAATLTGTGRPRRKEILNLYTKEISDEFLRPTG
ncbi:MAG: AMP-binding protein [Alphaproteobacteria bacterium]|nr:AMP-binding protein [Alphaproteobacteria bacterium]